MVRMDRAEPALSAPVFLLELPRRLPRVLGVGAFLKNTVTLIDGCQARMSGPAGDLGTPEAISRFEAAVENLTTGTRPGCVAHDLHPDFFNTRFALAFGAETRAVQHHHAHVAAVMAEYGLEGPVLGLALDGFGLGPENQSWGGELLRVDRSGYLRLGHFRPLGQPGGDVAAREPWRMAAAALHALGRGSEIARRFAHHPGAPVVARMLERNFNCPPTSSAGRLFDAACGLLGVVPLAHREGEAPMALERLASHPRVMAGGWNLADGVLDLRPLLDRLAGMEPEAGSGLFHGTLAAALASWAGAAADATGLATVIMSGGCFLNRVLARGVTEGLAARGLTSLAPRRLSPGDGAVSLGQAWAAALAFA